MRWLGRCCAPAGFPSHASAGLISHEEAKDSGEEKTAQLATELGAGKTVTEDKLPPGFEPAPTGSGRGRPGRGRPCGRRLPRGRRWQSRRRRERGVDNLGDVGGKVGR